MRAPKGVPRDEWLLAIGLSNVDQCPHPYMAYRALAPDDKLMRYMYGDGSDESAFANGFWMEAGPVDAGDEGNPDAYAAGAALAIAMESKSWPA